LQAHFGFSSFTTSGCGDNCQTQRLAVFSHKKIGSDVAYDIYECLSQQSVVL
jgi:hypothetical protein